MKRVGIIPNLEKKESFEAAKKLFDILSQKNCDVLMEQQKAEKIGFEGIKYTEEEFFENSDFIVLLGGDGTILDISKKAAFANVPLLGINLGHLGFLTDTDRKGMEEAVLKVLDGDYIIDRHMMLEADVKSASDGENVFYCLNEFAVSRGNMVSL